MAQNDLEDRVMLLEQELGRLSHSVREPILTAMIDLLEAIAEPEISFERPRKPNASTVPVQPIRDVLNRLGILRALWKRT